MLERFALPPALHQIAQWRHFRAIKRTLELEIKLHPRAPEHVRKQVFRVQSRVVDPVLSEIRRRRLQDFEQRLRFCHVERSRDIPGHFRNSKRFLYFGRNDRRKVLTPKSTTLSTAPPYRLLGARESSRRGRHQDRKSTRLNSSHVSISYAVFCLKK